MTTVRQTLSPDELNVVLVALSRLPYFQVHELIARIQTEVGPQLLAASARVDENGSGSAGPGGTGPDSGGGGR